MLSAQIQLLSYSFFIVISVLIGILILNTVLRERIVEKHDDKTIIKNNIYLLILYIGYILVALLTRDAYLYTVSYPFVFISILLVIIFTLDGICHTLMTSATPVYNMFLHLYPCVFLNLIIIHYLRNIERFFSNDDYSLILIDFFTILAMFIQGIISIFTFVYKMLKKIGKTHN